LNIKVSRTTERSECCTKYRFQLLAAASSTMSMQSALSLAKELASKGIEY